MLLKRKGEFWEEGQSSRNVYENRGFFPILEGWVRFCGSCQAILGQRRRAD
jgi:hypothetical protein